MDIVPEGLWMEICDIIQEAGIKTIPMVKKCKKAKWLSDEGSQITEKREAKGKGEKEIYAHLNAEFQRIARRDKKAFLSDKCREIEENNRMRKTGMPVSARSRSWSWIQKPGVLQSMGSQELDMTE